MLKLQDNEDIQKVNTKSQRFICMSPYCFDFQHRQFGLNSAHFSNQPCSKWIIDISQVQKPIEYFKISEIRNLQFNFVDAPITYFNDLRRLQKSDWKKQIDKEKNNIKKQLSAAVDKQFGKLKQNIASMIFDSQFYSKLMDKIKQNVNLDQLSVVINQQFAKSYEMITRLKTRTLLSTDELQKYSKKSHEIISCLSQKFLIQKSNCSEINMEHKMKFYHFMFDDEDNVYGKLQILAATFGIQPNNFSINSEQIKLGCFICPMQCNRQITPINKKQCKKQLSKQILMHLYCSHYGYVCFNFCKKVSKCLVQSISMEQFMKNSQHYDDIYLIDRQSGISYDQNIQDQAYTLEIISHKNKHMAKGKYLFVENREAIDAIISILAYLCSNREQNVTIFTAKMVFGKAVTNLMPSTVNCKKQITGQLLFLKHE